MATPASRAAHALVYAAVGAELHVYDLDVAAATLVEWHGITLPADIQSAWAQPAGHQLMVAWSDGTNVSPGTRHGLSAVKVDATRNGLQLIGDAVALPSRPIYVSVDRHERHALVTYTSPSGVTVHALTHDLRPGPALEQAPAPMGIYGHQFVVDPAGTSALLVGRGNVQTASRAEDPGSLEVFDYHDGRLTHRQTLAPAEGIGFHPRYVDYHPTQPWLFVSLSQQNALGVYRRGKEGALDPARIFEVSSLTNPADAHPGQLAGALHLHPNGQVAYLANRAVSARKEEDKAVSGGGENGIAVFSIDSRLGTPRLVQTVDSHGIGPVEFALDPSARLLIVANMMRQWREEGGVLRALDSGLVLFRVHEDGTLEYVRQYDFAGEERNLFWMGIGAKP